MNPKRAYNDSDSGDVAKSKFHTPNSWQRAITRASLTGIGWRHSRSVHQQRGIYPKTSIECTEDPGSLQILPNALDIV